jgi:hypothetical protein
VKIFGEFECRRVAIGRVLLETLEDDGFEIFGDLRMPRPERTGFFREDRTVRALRASGFEGASVRETFEERDARAPG